VHDRREWAQGDPAAAGPGGTRRPGPVGSGRTAQHKRPDRVPAPQGADRRRPHARPRRQDAPPRPAQALGDAPGGV